ncbi:MAG: ATP-binding protein [Rickettsiaceae bacterium]|nr:ATP-binding protein [Rickettsiaceae bacterium]
MTWNIDIIIVVSFLIINLAVGFYYGRGVKNIKQYAIGDRNFSTALLTATVIATWVEGSDFARTLSEVYNGGILYFLAGTGEVVSLLVVALIFAPRMGQFFGSISIAESMGRIYGTNIRVIVAIASVITTGGIVATQLKVFSMLFGHIVGVPELYSILISSVIVTTYSAFGGVKAVTFTDAIQFITFGLIIPAIAFFMWKTFGNFEVIDKTLENPLFDYKQLPGIGSLKFWEYFSLFFCFAVPGIRCSMFQRILMSKDTKQVRTAFLIGACVVTMLILFTSLIGILIFADNPNLSKNDLIPHIIDDYFAPGIRGILVLAILAMVMSTADSSLNAGAVLVTHDIFKPLNSGFKNELLTSKIFSFILGFIAVILTLSSDSILELVLLTENFYMPVVTAPLTLAIFGFRTNKKVILIAIATAIAFVIYWRTFIQPITEIDSLIPGVLANLLTILFLHYVLGFQGGWDGDKDNQELIQLKKKNQRRLIYVRDFIVNFPRNISNFNIIEYCRLRAPKQDIAYIYFALCVFLNLLAAVFISNQTYKQYMYLVNISLVINLFITTSFFSNRIWPARFREKYLGVTFYIASFIGLILISSIFVLLSNFAPISTLIFIINLTILGFLLNWQTTLVMIILGVWGVFSLYQSYMSELIIMHNYSIKLQTIYILLAFGGFILAFIKPKQEELEMAENTVSYLDNQVSNLGTKVTHFSEKIMLQEKEIERLSKVADTILNNVNHNLRLPIGNVINFAEMLKSGLESGLEKYGKNHIKMLTEEVYKNSNKVSTMILNMLDLALLQVKKIKLEKSTINFSEMVINRVKACKSIYLENKNLTFKIDIQPEVMVMVDPNYMRQTIDNLVINSIKYSEKGVINISLRKLNGQVKFSISDEGIGIPKRDIITIFEPFTVSTKTTTGSGNRGVGLSLCKSAITAHAGEIKAKSNGSVGASFSFTLPLNTPSET